MDDLFQALRSYIPLIPEGMEVRGQRTAAPDAEELRWRVDLDLRGLDGLERLEVASTIDSAGSSPRGR